MCRCWKRWNGTPKSSKYKPLAQGGKKSMLSGKPTLFRAIVLPVVVKVQVWWWSECVRFWKYRYELKYSRLDTRPGPNTNVELGLESWNRSIKWTLEGHLGWHKSYRIRGPIKTPDGRFRIVDDHESKQLLPRWGDISGAVENRRHSIRLLQHYCTPLSTPPKSHEKLLESLDLNLMISLNVYFRMF